MKFLFAFLLMISSLAAFARDDRGDHVGNGGKVVVCWGERPSDLAGIRSIELLDFYEGFAQFDLKASAFDGSPFEIATAIIDRLAATDPEKYRRYLKLLAFFKENYQVGPIGFDDSADTGIIIAPPPGCTYEQIAMQIRPVMPGEKYFKLYKHFWEHPRLTDRDRGGLIVHEIIFYDTIQRSLPTSREARRLTALLASEDILHENGRHMLDRFLSISHLRDVRITDPAGTEWVFAESEPLNWQKATDYCKSAVGGVIPSWDNMKNSYSFLSFTAIADILSEKLVSETWTSTRHSTNGLIDVVKWTTSIPMQESRYMNDHAYILCQRTTSGDSL